MHREEDELQIDTSIEVSAEEDLDSLAGEWNELASRPVSDLAVPGCSSTWEWHKCLQGFLLSERDTLLLTARCNGKLCCILPLVIGEGSLFGMKWPVLEHWQDVAYTRPGLITSAPVPEVLAAILANLIRLLPWGVLKITLIGDSRDESAFIEAARRNGLVTCEVSREVTGYISIPGVMENTRTGSLSKKFRANLRRNLRKLEEEGDVELLCMRQQEDVDDFMRYVWDIELNSWKHEKGTTIRQQPAQEYLYTNLANFLAARYCFLGSVLMHAGKPIAFDYGVVHNGIYECLKTSYRSDYGKLMPSHLMRSLLIRKLHESGILVHDFIGLMDKGKQQWKSIPYTRVTHLVYGPGWKGKTANIKRKLKKKIASSADRLPWFQKFSFNRMNNITARDIRGSSA